MSLALPIISIFFAGGLICLMGFSFFATILGFIAGLIAFYKNGCKDIQVFNTWWALTTGVIIIYTLIIAVILL